jgi:FAD/FMN-containing dehydrogenase
MASMSLIESLKTIIGPGHVLTGTAIAPNLTDIHHRFAGRAQALARPGSVEEVAAIVRLCAGWRVPLVVQGGNTGLQGAATPEADGKALLLSLSRLKRIRQIDTDNDTITVEAGAVLQTVQEAALAAGRLFPLSLGTEGSCTIGGNLGTNAGGTQVLRYGNARELTLGLEVVTADGELWDGLRGLRKDNTGYDLRDLFIGSEGTLGIITAATLRLYPLPAAQATGFLAFPGLAEAVAFLAQARQGFGASLTGFEVVSAAILRVVATQKPQVRLPFSGPDYAPWYALVEISDNESEARARTLFEKVVGEGLAAGVVLDAVVAESLAQRKAFWHLREQEFSEAQLLEGGNIKHDISVPISRIAEFVETTGRSLQAYLPGIRPVVFGHLGDGNLHYHVAHPEGGSAAEFFSRHKDAVQERVYDSVHRFNGSISAEHGIGQSKRDLLPRYKQPLELELMRRIKVAFDPLNILNPGKVLAEQALGGVSQ